MGGQERAARAAQLPPLVPMVPGIVVPSYPMGVPNFGYAFGTMPPQQVPWNPMVAHPMISVLHSGFNPTGMPWSGGMPIQPQFPQQFMQQSVAMMGAPCAAPPPPVHHGPPKNTEESERAAGT